MTAATEDEEVLSFRIAELNSGRSFVVGYGGVWKLLSAVDKLQQYGAAAEATAGQVLTYNGKLKLVPYHEISSGKTRDGKEVFHSAEYGYLKSVESSRQGGSRLCKQCICACQSASCEAGGQKAR